MLWRRPSAWVSVCVSLWIRFWIRMRLWIPSSARIRIWARLGACCGLAALCLGTACLARRAAEVQRRMVGVSAQALQSCLGAPSSFESLEGREVWFYEALYSGPSEDVTIEISRGPNAPTRGPNVISGDVARDTLRSTERREPAGPGVQRGTCVLMFEIEGGRILRFQSAGRTPNGVNAAAECALLVRRCAPESAPGSAPLAP